MTRIPSLAELRADVRAAGLAWRGAFHPQPTDAVPALTDGGAVGTVALLGFVGGAQTSTRSRTTIPRSFRI